MFSLPFYVATSADKVWRTGMAWSMPCIPLVTQVYTCSYYIATWKTEAIIKDMQEFTRPLGAYLRLVLSQSGVA